LKEEIIYSLDFSVHREKRKRESHPYGMKKTIRIIAVVFDGGTDDLLEKILTNSKTEQLLNNMFSENKLKETS